MMIIKTLNILSNFLYTLLATVFYFKISNDKRKKALLYSIKQNKKMSEPQRLRRFFQFLHILLEPYFRQGSYCILSGILIEYQPLFYETLIRRIRRLKRKGYKVRVEIWMKRKVFEKYNQETQILLMTQGVQVE